MRDILSELDDIMNYGVENEIKQLSMAFTLYQSNRQEDLFTLFAAVQRQGDLPTLFTEQVIIPSLGIAKWLTIELAELHGIAANIQFELPGAFFWQLARVYFPDLPDRSPYRPEVLSWRIDALLQKHIIQTGALQPYLGNKDERKRGQLAQILSCLFDQYLVYRPDWLMKWEANQTLGLGEDEDWQAQLWRLLVKEIGLPHRANFFAQLLEVLLVDPRKLPSRILCFGVNNLPPVYFTLLQTLSTVIDVHYFVLNPSKENWIEDRDVQEQLRLTGLEDPELLYFSTGNPLLSSWGKLGRDFFARLMDVPSIDVFPDKHEMLSTTRLQSIQRDIICREVPEEPSSFLVNDQSLSIQSCHSPKREIEVLHDHILHWLQNDPTLLPNDILVMAPNIDLYQPYIEAVFASADVPAHIPFSVADKNPLQHSALFSVFFALLSLPSQRFEAAWILEIISHPALLRAFGLKMTHMPLLREWVQEVHILWGRDAQHKADYGLPTDCIYTWRDGLERLLLGFILPKEMANNGPPIFSDRFPSNTITTSQRKILTGFVSLIETLIHYAEHFSVPQTPKVWVSEILALIQTCFIPDEEEEKALLLLQTHLANLLEESQEAAFEEEVSIAFFAEILRKHMDKPVTQLGFLSRGLTFCDMVPMRTIPARIICVLGLNHDNFPRQVGIVDIDLMRAHPRAGDRAHTAADRYLFLETLLSAKEKLYLSYIGQDIRTNQTLPPSVLIDELLDVIDEYYSQGTPSREQLVKIQALQAFDPIYFQEQSSLHSFHSLWLAVAKANRLEKSALPGLFTQALPFATIRNPIPLETLLRFYRNPTRFLLQSRLDIFLPWQSDEEAEGMPVLLDKKQRLQVRERLIDYPEHAAEILRLEGILPQGVFGDYPFMEESQLIKAWQEKQATRHKIDTLDIGLVEVFNWQLTGSLLSIDEREGMQLQSLHDSPLASERIGAWIQHLLRCIATPAGKNLSTSVSGIKEGFCYKPCTSDEAKVLLRPWLAYFEQGLCEPLPFFARTSLHFAENIYRGKSIEEALASAKTVFLPGVKEGEGNDAYLFAAYRAIPDLNIAFIDVAQSLLLPMLAYQEKEDAST